MMRLWLSDEQAQTLLDHARRDAPCEACGLIVGTGERASYIIPIANTAPNPLSQYYMDERELGRALMQAAATGFTLIGIYHSHPQGDPIPSPADVAQATYPNTAYVIIGLKRSEIAAWTIGYGRVQPVTLHTGSQAPIDAHDAPLRPAQKIAVLIAALLAFVVMIVLSLSLLPPAPVIPR